MTVALGIVFLVPPHWIWPEPATIILGTDFLSDRAINHLNDSVESAMDDAAANTSDPQKLRDLLKSRREQLKNVREAMLEMKKSADETRKVHDIRILEILAAVALIFAIDLIVLWLLRHRINPLAAHNERLSEKSSFQGKFKGMGGTITVAAAGSLGSFLTVLAATIAAILILDKFG